MVWTRARILRRLAGLSLCSVTVLGVGCAGGPLSLRNQQTELVTAESAAQNGVVAIDTIGQPPATTTPATASGVQQTNAVGPEAAKPAPERKNFASIFGGRSAEESKQMPDPFAASVAQQEPAKQPINEAPATVRMDQVGKPSQPAGAPAASSRLSSDFDRTMAALSGTKTASVPNRQQETKKNPFAELAAKEKVAKDDAATLAAQLDRDLKAELERTKAKARSIATDKGNPFADFVDGGKPKAAKTPTKSTADQKAIVSVGDLDAPAASRREPTPQATKPTADWIREATAALPAPGDAQGTAPAAAPAKPDVDMAAAKERVRQLLDASELALRGGRYGEAESIATDAFQIAETEHVTFGDRERTPATLLRRIASTKRLSGVSSDSNFDFVDVQQQELTAETTPVVAAAESNSADNTFRSFPTVTTWEPIEDDDSATVYHASTTAWQPASAPFTAATPDAPQEQAIQTTAAETANPSGIVNDTAAGWSTGPSFGTADPAGAPDMPSLKEDAPAPPMQHQGTADIGGLPAPSWATSAPKTASLSAPPSTAGLPQLPEFPSSAGDTSFQAAAWPTETVQTAMADADVAPPAPLIVEGGVADKSLNFGTILALMTVIGLGLVAVLAFRTRPEEV